MLRFIERKLLAKVILSGVIVSPLLISVKPVDSQNSYRTSTNAQLLITSSIQLTIGSSSSTKEEIRTSELSQWLIIGKILGLVGFCYLVVLWKRPLWLLYLPSELVLPGFQFLSPLKKIPTPIMLWLKYQPRVLDAWVAKHIDRVKERFECRSTVEHRKIHIPLPIEFDDGKKEANFLSDEYSELEQTFARDEFCLLICGEGGSGKTSLAYQIAKWAMTRNPDKYNHRMIPVIIEDELEKTSEDKSPALVSIVQQLKNLRIEEKQISGELLKQLLEKRRVLVIIDHLSEMNEYSREAVRKILRRNDAQLPINALIITSRSEEILSKESTCTIIRPLRISGEQLSIFMDAYLRQLGKRTLFQDAEYFTALGHLSQIVTDEGKITVLFAKLYADQMIAAVEGKRREELPKNLPELILGYLNELNRNQVTKRLPDPIVHRDAQIIAWKSLESTFKPETADRNEIIKAIAALEEQENSKAIAEQHLQYLEGEPLHLIRVVAPAKTRVRFSLDPLAEYLAALYVVERYQGNVAFWKEFIEQAKIKSNISGNIKGFLLAVRYSCIARPEFEIPEFVMDELARLADLDLEVLREEQLRRRINRLTTSLSLPDKSDRIFAAEELKSIGSSAIKALPALLEAIDDPDQEVRISILKAIANIGALSESESYLTRVSPDLTKFISKVMDMFGTGDKLVEMAAIDALAHIGSPAIPALEKTLDSRNRYVRFQSIEALINLGLTAIPALEKATRNKSSYIRYKATEALEQLKEKGI